MEEWMNRQTNRKAIRQVGIQRYKEKEQTDKGTERRRDGRMDRQTYDICKVRLSYRQT